MPPESVDTVAVRMDDLAEMVGGIRIDIREIRKSLEDARQSHDELHRLLAASYALDQRIAENRMTKVETAITWRTGAGGVGLGAVAAAVLAIIAALQGRPP